MSTPLMLLEGPLSNATDEVTDLVKEIQDLIGPSLTFDQKLGAGTLSGTTDNLSYSLSLPFNESATLIPGVPALTVTPAIPATTITPAIPAVMSPATPSLPATTITPRVCIPWVGCTPAVMSPKIPGVPAFTITPAVPAVVSPAVPAVITPAVPATTGSISGSLTTSVTIKGLSEALTPILESTKLDSTSISGPNGSGLANQVTEWLSSGTIQSTDLDVTATAGWQDLQVTVAGVTTNLGSVNMPLMSNDQSASSAVYLPLTNVSGSITTSVNWPSNDGTNQRTRKNKSGVVYDLFPQANTVKIDDFTIDPGESIVAKALDSTLGQLDNYWNTYVCGAFSAVGLGSYCLESPTQSLVNEISGAVSGIDDTLGTQLSITLNEDLTSTVSKYLPYTQAIAAATWNLADYPLVPSGNYIGAILNKGIFSGINGSGADFSNADLSYTNFSNAILSGAIFDGANLTGADFSGATGSPNTSSGRKSLRSAPASFKGATLFGANLKGSDLNLSGALIDGSAKTDKTFDANKENVTLINPYNIILSNNLLKNDIYAESPLEVLKRLAGNLPLHKEKAPAKKGALSLFLSGNLSNELSLDQAKDYLAKLPEKLQEKLEDLPENDLIEKVSKSYVNWATKDKTYFGRRANDLLTGMFGDDNMSGGTGADKLLGGEGSDILDGGKGNDKLKGGGDDDTFKISGGNDVVTDFKIKDLDSIDLTGVRHAFATAAGEHTIITTEKGSLTLKGVLKDSLESLYEQALDNLDLYQPIISSVPVQF